MQITKKYLDDLTYQIIGAAIDIHKLLARDYWRVSTTSA